jgi:hypothetical protein
MKKIIKVAVIAIVVVASSEVFTSCTQKMCPTYGYHTKR